MPDTLAIDRADAIGAKRWKDEDGRLHVDGCRISKATVNPYRGEEVPRWRELGLDPQRVYQLFRDPDELAKAAPTFHGLQLMSRHKAVDSENPEADLVAGTLGTNPRFEAPYLINDVIVWRAEDVADVESRDKCQLSMGYYYDADMTPGEYQGLRYDGIMRNIRGNHAALVEAGRAGPDVMVHDKEFRMPLASRKALIVKGALTAYLRPKLMPGTVLALDSILGTVNGANWKTQQPLVLSAIQRWATPKLAADASLKDLPVFIGAFDEEDDDEEAEDELEGMDEAERKEEEDARREEEEKDVKAEDRMKAAKDRKAARDAKRAMDKKAMDAKKARDAKKAKDAKKGKDVELEEWAEEEEEEPAHSKDKKAKDGKAMDELRASLRADIIGQMNAAVEAREIVRPLVGRAPLALDSAAAVYEWTLRQHKIALDGVHPSAYRAMVGMIQKPGAAAPKPSMTFDHAGDGEIIFGGGHIRFGG